MSANSSDPTKRYYEDHAAQYATDAASVNLGQLYDRFAAMLPAGAVVLDVGCGSGRDLKALKEKGLNPTGIDYSEALVTIARQESGQPVAIGDVRTHEFGEGQFQGLWAIASLLHIPRAETPGLLIRLFKSLRPAGVLVTSMQLGNKTEWSKDGRFFEQYGQDEWEDLLRTAGFRVVRGDVTHVGEQSWFVTFGTKGTKET